MTDYINNHIFQGPTESITEKVCSVCRYQGDCLKLHYVEYFKCDLIQELMAVMHSCEKHISIEDARLHINKLKTEYLNSH